MLRRGWARAAWALLAASAALMIVRLFASFWELTALSDLCVNGVLLLAGAYLLIRCLFLRCPHCRRGVAQARWRAGEDGYCRYCGKPFAFDDDGGEGAP